MAEEQWSVQIGKVDDPGDTGIPPVPQTVFEGDEAGARAAFAEHRSTADTTPTYRYVMLRRVAEVVELWGTPPAVA